MLQHIVGHSVTPLSLDVPVLHMDEEASFVVLQEQVIVQELLEVPLASSVVRAAQPTDVEQVLNVPALHMNEDDSILYEFLGQVALQEIPEVQVSSSGALGAAALEASQRQIQWFVFSHFSPKQKMRKSLRSRLWSWCGTRARPRRQPIPGRTPGSTATTTCGLAWTRRRVLSGRSCPRTTSNGIRLGSNVPCFWGCTETRAWRPLAPSWLPLPSLGQVKDTGDMVVASPVLALTLLWCGVGGFWNLCCGLEFYMPCVPGSHLFGVLGVASCLQSFVRSSGCCFLSAGILDSAGDLLVVRFLGFTQKGEVCTVVLLVRWYVSQYYAE